MPQLAPTAMAVGTAGGWSWTTQTGWNPALNDTSPCLTRSGRRVLRSCWVGSGIRSTGNTCSTTTNNSKIVSNNKMESNQLVSARLTHHLPIVLIQLQVWNKCFLRYVHVLEMLTNEMKDNGCWPKKTTFLAPLAAPLGRYHHNPRCIVRDRPPSMYKILAKSIQQFCPKQPVTYTHKQQTWYPPLTQRRW